MAPPPSWRAPSARRTLVLATTSPFARPLRISNVFPSMKMLSFSEILAGLTCACATADIVALAASARAKAAASSDCDLWFSQAPPVGSSWSHMKLIQTTSSWLMRTNSSAPAVGGLCVANGGCSLFVARGLANLCTVGAAKDRMNQRTNSSCPSAAQLLRFYFFSVEPEPQTSPKVFFSL